MQLTRLTRRAMSRVRLSAVARDLRHAVAALLIVGVAAACSDDNKNVNPTPTPSITLTTGSPTAAASPGTPATIAVAITRAGGYTGDVALAIEGLATGITAVASPVVLTNGVVGSNITVSVGPTAVAGSSTVIIRAIGNGVTTVSSSVVLTVTIPAAITLTAGSTTVTAPQGGSQTVGFTIDRSGGFTGAVTLTAEGLPAGVTAAFTPVGAGVNNSTLTLTVGNAVAVGNTAFTVRASGAGVTDKTLPMQLSVTASTTPDFTLTAAPAALTVVAGANGSSVITVARSGPFTGNVSLANSALPAGVTASFTPNPATANTSTLAFTTTSAAVAGTYPITVTGTGTGLANTRTVVVTLTINPPAGVTGALSATSGSVVAGASTTSNLTITRVGGFAGDVAMTAENVPANVTVTFAPATILAANTTSAITIASTAAAAAGTYTINLRATGAGGVTTVIPYALTVTSAQSFAVAFTSSTISLAAGGTGSLTANITRSGGFTGAVNFAVTGLPAGITAALNPAAATGATTAVQLTVGSGVTAGNYTGTLTGTATGLTTTNTAFTVTVTAGGGGGSGNISWAFCDASRVPVFFAFRDGSTGAWTRVTPNASNAFLFTVNASVGGVAYVYPTSNGGFATNVFLQTATELQQTASSECTSNAGGSKTMTGTVTGLAAPAGFTTQGATVALGNASVSIASGNTNYTLNKVSDGVLDLIGIRTTTVAVPFSSIPDAIILRRSLNLATGTVIPLLAFGGSEAFSPSSATMSVTNGGSDVVSVTTKFTTQGGVSALLGLPSLSSTATMYGVPVAKQAASDMHEVTVGATDNTATNSRGAILYFKDLVNKSVALGPVLNAPTVTAAFNTVLRPRVQGAFQTEYPGALAATFTQSFTNRATTITATKGYFGNGAANFDLDTPDLTTASGFQATWGMGNGFTTTYSVNGSNALTAVGADGTSLLFAARTGQVPAASIRASVTRR